ncbi:30S ribosomal protein S15 [Candidatus Woesearchaeota archaeon]|nr:30S ribosomal protein S15 [Candidatus Woesearchaeota archaeon]
MARMHSRDKGKSGPKKPSKKVVPSWTRYKKKEVELLIIKLAKEEKSPSEIGLILRDTYGVPDVRTALGRKITKILEEKKLLKEIPEDLMNLMKKAISVKKHLERNNKDMTAKRGQQLTESKINRLIKYYKRTGKIAKDWKYEPDRLRLYIE